MDNYKDMFVKLQSKLDKVILQDMTKIENRLDFIERELKWHSVLLKNSEAIRDVRLRKELQEETKESPLDSLFKSLENVRWSRYHMYHLGLGK
jgi:hypothetical protein|tara:strand:- start:3864 stop:4142 length:279 start_codon:yes stop_codon:yes gene_type:complete